jgi:hypothetical protein
MKYEKELLELKNNIIKLSAHPNFIHHLWFVEHHLDIVENIAMELCDIYPDADRDIVHAMVWMHDYWKIIDFDNEYRATQQLGGNFMQLVWLPEDFSKKVLWFIEIMDQKLEIDISKTALEIQIISSADGCSHYVGPFLNLWWHENSSKDYKELMADNIYKINKDWNHKIVLPEAREAFEDRYKLSLEKCWNFPDKYI